MVSFILYLFKKIVRSSERNLRTGTRTGNVKRDGLANDLRSKGMYYRVHLNMRSN
jgi:hypothetical protein